MHQSYLSFDDQIGTADIEVIAPAAREILELPARSVFAEIELEAYPPEPIEQVLVPILPLLGEQATVLPCQLQRDGRRDEITVLERVSLVIERVGQLCARLDIDDQGGAALNKGDLCSARVQVLRNIVAAVARAD